MPAVVACAEQLQRVGWLHRSSPSEGLEVLRQRMTANGYLYLPGLLDRQQVLEARQEVRF